MDAEMPSSISSPFCHVMLATVTLALPEVKAVPLTMSVAVVYFKAPVAAKSAKAPPDTFHCNLKVSAAGF
jgi:hypothetical protein